MTGLERTMGVVLAASAALVLGGCEARHSDDKTTIEVKTDQGRAAEAGRDIRDSAHQAGQDIKEGAQQAGQEIKEGAQEAGDAIADATKKAFAELDAEKQEVDVKAAITVDQAIDASHVEVESNTATKTIYLKGSVPTEAQKVAAETAARNKAEGYTVVNQLTVGTPTGTH